MKTTPSILTTSIAALLLAGAASTGYADTTWIGNISSDWTNSANWDNGLPNDQHYIVNKSAGNGAAFTADFSTSLPGGSAPHDIVIGRNGGSIGIVNQRTGSVSTGGGGWLFVGDGGGNGKYNLADANGTGSVGVNTGLKTGTGSLTDTGELFVGHSGGTGVFNLNTTGTLSFAGNGHVGGDAGSNGTFNIDAGTLSSSNSLEVGTGGGIGRLNQSGGTVSLGQVLYLGRGGNNTTQTGTLNMSGGVLNTGNDLTLGDNGGGGIINQTGGTITVNGWLKVGNDSNTANNKGTLNVSGGILHTPNIFAIAAGGSSTTGVATISGTGVVNADNQLFIGNGGGTNGTLTVENGGTVNAGDFIAVGRSGGVGTLTINAGGFVSKNGNNTLEQTNANSGGSATVNLNGGILLTNHIAWDGGNGATVTMNFNGGTLKPFQNDSDFIGGGVGNGHLKVKAGGAIIDTNGKGITIQKSFEADPVSTGGGLTKNGAGTLVLSAVSTYAGNTVVNAGVLQSNNGSATGAFGGDGKLIINNGGILQTGAGVVDGLGFFNHTANNSININVGGTLRTLDSGRQSMDRDIFSVGGTIDSQGGNFQAGASYAFRATSGAGGPANLYNFTSSSAGTGGVASTISAVNVGIDNATFNVTAGGGAVDLNVTGNLQDQFGTGGLTKTGNGVMILASTANTYTGKTAVNGGTLVISGSISGSTALTVNNGGTLLLASVGAVNSSATLGLGGGAGATSGGTLKIADNLGTNTAAATETFGALTLSFNSAIDFGTSAAGGVKLYYSGFGAHTAGTGPDLAITNWTGVSYTLGTNLTDRLIFGGNASDFTAAFAQADISFNGITGYQAISFGTNSYEIVAVPEPSTWLFGTALLGLAGWRERRRSLRKAAALV